MKSKPKYNSVFSSGTWVSDKNPSHANEKKTYLISIKDLNLYALIGIHPHEKKTKQKILINVTLNSYDTKNYYEIFLHNTIFYYILMLRTQYKLLQ